MRSCRERQLVQRRDILVATAAVQRAQLVHDLRQAPWMPALRGLRTAWRIWRLVRSLLRR
jgi:hypothetical protein